MRNLIVLFTLLLSLNLFAQNGLKKIDIDPNFNLANSPYGKLEMYYFKLPEIANSEYKFHFRYIKNSQVVDLFSNDSLSFQGKLLNYIIEKENDKPRNYVYQISNLDNNLATKIGKQIFEKKNLDIPTDRLIKNWSYNWFDCGNINLTFKVNNTLFNKNFTCLHNQNDSLEFVNELKKNDLEFNQTLQLEEQFESFKSKLEKGKSYSNGYWTMYKMTEEQIAGWEIGKPRREYLYSIKDTITNHLEKKLNELVKNVDKLHCYGDFEIVFSKKGQAKRINISEPIDKDDYECKKIIKKALRKIKFDFVDLKYDFTRTINFWDNKINVYDRTIY